MNARLLLPALLLAVAGGCSYYHWRSEEYQRLYGQPATATDRTNLERKKILTWAKDPKTKERIGYLEHYEVTLAGSRTPKEYWIIKDRYGLEELGYINQIGELYRYAANGTMAKIGEYPVIDLGVKMFFSVPLEHNIAFEDIDPYRD